MKFTNSPLVSYRKISPNRTINRNHEIDTITIHCVVGQVSVERLGEIFAPTSRGASSNYGVGYDGKIGMYCEEKDRSWCSGGRDKNGKDIRVNGISGADNDHRAITIEVASDTTDPYKVNDAAYKALIKLLVDICQRNNIKELKWQGDKSLVGQVDKQNMTVHRWFSTKSCPGDYLYGLHGQIAKEVNSILLGNKIEESTSNTPFYDSIKIGDIYNFKGSKHYSSANASRGKSVVPSKVKITQKYLNSAKYPIHARSVDDKGNYTAGNVNGWISLSDIEKIEFNPFKVRVTATALNYRKGPSVDYPIVGTIRDQGVYTIIEEKNGWGFLKSKSGWINLGYTQRL